MEHSFIKDFQARRDRQTKNHLSQTRSSFERYADIYLTDPELFPTAACVTDDEGYFLAFNRKYLDIYGYEHDELVGAHFSMLVPECQRKKLSAMHDQFIRDGHEMDTLFEVLTKQGIKRMVHVTASRVLLGDGSYGKVTMVMDITEQLTNERRLIERLESQLARSEARERAMEILLHDLGNYVGAMQMAAELKKEIPDGAQLDNVISKNLLQAEKLLSEHSKILRLEQGNYIPEVKLIRVSEMIKEIIEENTAPIRSSRIRLHYNEQEHPLPEIENDPFCLRTACTNLLINAIQASPDGIIGIRLRETRDSVLIKFYNSEMIPENIQSSFFQRYLSERENHRGTGLGTYITKLMCDAMGGEIRFATSKSRGTVITMNIKKKISQG